MSANELPINPRILTWAREDAGFSLAEAAARAKIGALSSKNISSSDRLQLWETGQAIPTLNQLKQIAHAYRRPLITFFLSEPPQKEFFIDDYRTLPFSQRSKDTPEFAALKRYITNLHKVLKKLLVDDGTKEISFVGRFKNSKSVPALVKGIKQVLGTDQGFFAKNLTGKDELFEHYRERLHRAGVFVLLQGNLGSHHSNISVEEFRGMAIADKIAPTIIINSNDAKAARVFTLIHELAHLLLGASGVSNNNIFESRVKIKEIERLCNQVAAEVLVPKEELLSCWEKEQGEVIDKIERISKRFKVSGSVVNIRLYELHKISYNEYSQILDEYRSKWDEIKKELKEKEGGPKRIILDKKRLGEKIISTIVSAANNNQLTLQEASQYLAISVKRFKEIG